MQLVTRLVLVHGGSFAAHVGGCEVVDLDAAHMCMISRPEALTELLVGISRSVPPAAQPTRDGSA